MQHGDSENSVILALGNTFEFNERHNANLSLAALSSRRRIKDSFGVSGDLALLWGGDLRDRIVVTPQRPSPQYVEYLQARLGVEITVVTPQLRTGWVCRDLLTDAVALSRLVTIIEDRPVRVLAWGATTYYYEVLEALSARGIRILSHDFPALPDRWIVDYSDSKSGVRSLLKFIGDSGADVRVPRGFVCHDLIEARGLAKCLHEYTEGPVVMKADRGDGGKSVRLLNPHGSGKTFDAVWNEFVAEVRGDLFWDHADIVVEEAIGRGVELSTPSVDAWIDADGCVGVLGVQNMLTVQQRCVGFEMGLGVLSPDMETRLATIVKRIGDQLSMLGYRGWFDVDFLLPHNRDEGLYISEVNPRRTGGSSPLAFAAKVLSSNWSETYYFRAFERLELPHRISVSRLFSLISSLNRQYSKRSAEISPLHVRGLSLRRPYIGYVIYAKSKVDALRLESEFASRLINTRERVEVQPAIEISSSVRRR